MNTYFQLFSNVIERVPQYSWRGMFEHTKRLNGLLIKAGLVASGRLTSEVGIASISVAREIGRLKRGSGLLFVALYFKQCGVALQRYYGGHPIQRGESFPVSISLTRAGLPTRIPSVHRKVIRLGGERADRMVKLYLSWFSVCRILQLAKPISKATLKSIVYRGPETESFRELLGVIRTQGKRIILKYLPDAPKIHLHKGISWMPTWK